MNVRTVLQTFTTRFALLVLNFGIIIFTTNMWGSEGKGIISLLIADLAIVCFASNILVGSSISYFSSRLPLQQLIILSYIWSLLISLTIPFIVTTSHSQEYVWYLIIISFVFSLLTANTNIFIGQNNLSRFNLYTILQQLVLIVFLIIYIYVFSWTDVYVYFIAQICAYTLLFITSSIEIFKPLQFKNVTISKTSFKSLFSYGWKTQLYSFLHFLSNRLSYYFLEALQGIASVGVFSVGVAFSEAIWTVSRSLAVILYSDIISQKQDISYIQQTKLSLKICFVLTCLFVLIMMIIPNSFYIIVFGKDFAQTKNIIMLLSPGILAIAISNIIGHYFSALGILRILNIKAFIGLGITIIGSYLLIPSLGITGACITTVVANVISSIIVIYKFYTNTSFSLSDFIITKSEITMLYSKILSKIHS